MFYRCLNSMFDYCKSKPTFEGGAPEKEVDEDGQVIPVYNRKCTRDYKTCSERQLPSELHPVSVKEKATKGKDKKKAE